MDDRYTVMDSVRRNRLQQMWPKLPSALDTLSRCATSPCDDQQFRTARELVLRWLQFSKACESHVLARRSQMRQKSVTN